MLLDLEAYRLMLWVVVLCGLLSFLTLLFIAAPYGRHYRGSGWGPQLPSRWGWILMESPSVLAFAWIYAQGAQALEPAPLILLALWQVHYLHRSFVFPLRVRSQGRSMPVLVVLLALLFNVANSSLNASWIAELGQYESSWLSDPRFLLGSLIFLTGLTLNLHSDSVLIRLRKPGESGYHIPHGGGYRYVSCPNYLGELLEWLGWALATWSLSGAAFAFFTAANLIPRALSHHRWYRETFEDYPPERRAILPGIL